MLVLICDVGRALIWFKHVFTILLQNNKNWVSRLMPFGFHPVNGWIFKCGKNYRGPNKPPLNMFRWKYSLSNADKNALPVPPIKHLFGEHSNHIDLVRQVNKFYQTSWLYFPMTHIDRCIPFTTSLRIPVHQQVRLANKNSLSKRSSLSHITTSSPDLLELLWSSHCLSSFACRSLKLLRLLF